MKLGFTGTQIGMSAQQLCTMRDWFIANIVEEFHHGDCIGADYDAHLLVRSWTGLHRLCEIVGHPPKDASKRAFARVDRELPPEDYLVRNRAIVDSVDLLIAAPRTDREELRAGTWATIRYGRKVLGKDRVLILAR